jgi:hypothetical protein
MKYINKKILLILSIIAFTTLLISMVYRPDPKLINSNPKTGTNISNLDQSILLEFNKEIKLEDFSFKIDPNEDFTPVLSENRIVTLNFHKTFPINKKYLLTIVYKGKQLGEVIHFTTNVPKSTQYDARFNQEIQAELETQYSLMSKTPYETDEYRVVYSAPFTLEITIKNKSISTTDAISEVKVWVTKNGGDSMAHKYVVAP